MSETDYSAKLGEKLAEMKDILAEPVDIAAMNECLSNDELLTKYVMVIFARLKGIFYGEDITLSDRLSSYAMAEIAKWLLEYRKETNNE